MPVRWADVAGGHKVILPSGRIAHVLERVPGAPDLVMLRNDHGDTRPMTVDPGAYVPVIFDEEIDAYASLKAVFPHVEFLRSV